MASMEYEKFEIQTKVLLYTEWFVGKELIPFDLGFWRGITNYYSPNNGVCWVCQDWDSNKNVYVGSMIYGVTELIPFDIDFEAEYPITPNS